MLRVVWKSWMFEGIENFDWWFFFLLKNLDFFFLFSFFFFFVENFNLFCFFVFVFFWDLKICSLSKSEEDEDKDGVKEMKIYSWVFFFLKKLILWMRITLVGSWCGLLDKSLLNSCKKIISISNGFIHWNEFEVLTQCP